MTQSYHAQFRETIRSAVFECTGIETLDQVAAIVFARPVDGQVSARTRVGWRIRKDRATAQQEFTAPFGLG